VHAFPDATAVLRYVTFPRFPALVGDEAESVRLMSDSVTRFVAGLDGAGYDAAGECPRDVIDAARALGLFSLSLPAAYGGFGLSSRGYSQVVQSVSAEALGLAVTMSAHQGIGCRGIALYGTAMQCEHYLRRCARQDREGWYAALAMTEATGGSSLASTMTTATQGADGRWVLNGSKTYITNGGIADLYTVLARALPRSGGRPKLSTFIVERAHGVRCGPPMEKLGIRDSNTTELFFDDVVVPEENLLGAVGEGLEHAKGILRYGRTALSAGAVGVSKRLVRMAIEHALQRSVGGTTIAKYDMIREKVAEIVSGVYAADAVLCVTAGLLDAAPDLGFEETAMAKIFCSEVACNVADEALQIAGGAGYLRDLPFERAFRDTRIFPIFEGTNEVLRVLVAVTSMRGPTQSWVRRAGEVLGEATHAGVPEVAELEARWRGLIDDVDATLESLHTRYGHRMGQLQSVQKRLADANVLLYAMMCTLSRIAATPHEVSSWQARHLMPAACFFERAARRIRQLIAELEGDPAAIERQLADAAYDSLAGDAIFAE
jgi:acyl-CoA dehydrogenase family protein 9